jgi:hypothetical protein
VVSRVSERGVLERLINTMLSEATTNLHINNNIDIYLQRQRTTTAIEMMNASMHECDKALD